jgi:uncharacterized phage-like protein YoqJ
MGAPATIACTGHRLGRLPPSAPAKIRAAVRCLVGRHPGATWLCGGAIGTDQIAADEVLLLGERLELVLPFPPAIQAARWRPADRWRLLRQVSHAASVEVLRDHYHPGGYRQRNRRLVERADLLMAVWDGRRWGGTAATVLMAQSRGIELLCLWVR